MKKTITNVFAILFIFLFLTANAQRNTPAGAAYPFPQNKTYAYGMKPNNVNIADVNSAYDFWRANYAENCSGKWRIKSDDPTYTFSEGIGYGMLLSAYAADKELFDGLWSYYKSFKNGNGLMNWKIQGCNTINQSGGATDADLDAAMGLYIAHNQWGSTGTTNYISDCKSLIGAIMTYEVNQSTWNLVNGDGWGTGSSCFNPSYFAPGYYKVFKTITGNANWDNVYNRAYVVLNANKNSSTGLVSNWCDGNGGVSSCNGPQDYGWDACRNPWRLATDVLWNGSSSAKAILDQQTAFWQGKGAGQVSGPMPLGGGSGTYHQGAFIGPWGAGAMGATTNTANQNHVNAMYTENVNWYPSTSGTYFSGTLRLIGLFVQSGNFYLPSGVSAGIPVAGFTSSATSVCSGSSITFTDASSGTITSYAWDFGTDATPATGTTVGPNTVTWATPGSKTIKLTVTGPGGTDSKTMVVSVNAAGTAKFIKENMSIATPTTYSDQTGLYWWGDPAYTITKTVGKVSVKGTAVTNFKPFGIAFGDTKGDGTGTSYTKDFGKNMDIVIQIKNTVQTDSAYINLNFEDISGGKGEIDPDTGVVSWSNQKKKIGFLLLPGQSKKITIVVSKDPATVGGLLATSYACTLPSNCPSTSYTIDPSKISKILFFVNGDASLPAANRVYPNISPYDGTLEISYFVMGDSTSGCAGTVVMPAPTANYTSTSSSVCQGAPLTFTNTSTGTVTSYSWDFGLDATPATATTAGPHNVSWSTAGAKTIKLTVSGPDGTTSKTSAITVIATGPPKFIKDDFKTVASVPLFGNKTMAWWGDPAYVIGRAGNGKMTIKGTAVTNFKAFGLSFGDSKGDGTGTPFTWDFGSNMNLTFTLKNTVMTDSAYVTVTFNDDLNGVGEIFPDTTNLSWANQKRKIEVLLLPGETKKINFNVSNDLNAVGGFKAINYSCGTPNACPLTTYNLNASRISKILFFVNGDASLPVASRRYPNISPYDGTLEMSYFVMGDSTSTSCGAITGIYNETENDAFTVYPNPFKDSFTVMQNSTTPGDVSILISNLIGQVVTKYEYINTGSTVSKEFSFAGLNSGIYFLQLKTKTGTLVKKIIKE